MSEASNGFNPDQNTVSFDYLKAPNFQSLRADGVIGGVTPLNRIHMAIYSERPAIPRRMTYEVTDAGKIGDLVGVETRGSIVREMSADVFLDLRAAEAISEWLLLRINELKDIKAQGKNDDQPA